MRINNNQENSAQGYEMAFVIALFQPLIFTLCQPKRTASNQPWALVTCTPPSITTSCQATVGGEGWGEGRNFKRHRNSIEERWATSTKRREFSLQNKDWIENKRFLWVFISEKSLVRIVHIFSK